MANPFYIVVPVLGVCLAIAYVIRERSLRHLDTIQAGTLVLTLRPIRSRFAITAAVLVAVFLVLRHTFPRFMSALFISALLLLLATMVIAQFAGRRALNQAQFPAAFTRLYGVAQLFDLLGYGSLLGGMISTLWLQGHA